VIFVKDGALDAQSIETRADSPFFHLNLSCSKNVREYYIYY